jgi:hypothetical protein
MDDQVEEILRQEAINRRLTGEQRSSICRALGRSRAWFDKWGGVLPALWSGRLEISFTRPPAHSQQNEAGDRRGDRAHSPHSGRTD